MPKVPIGLLKFNSWASTSPHGKKRVALFNEPGYLAKVQQENRKWWPHTLREPIKGSGLTEIEPNSNFSPKETNLSFNDLRFWSGGMNSNSNYALCRCCSHYVNTGNRPGMPLFKQM